MTIAMRSGSSHRPISEKFMVFLAYSTVRRLAILSVLTLVIASCGGDDGSGDVAVVTAPTTVASTPSPTATPTPTPSPSPSSTPVTSPSPTVSPAQAPTAATPPTPIVLGSVTWSFYADPPADKRTAITEAMDFAVNAINTVARYSGHIPVAYQAGVPTAQANFQRSIEFGGSISGGVALHETAHWFGGGYVRWDSFMVDGRWQGAAGISRIRAYDGPDAVLRGDGAHYWPYGWNYPGEYVEPQRSIGILGAMRRDMGLSDGMADIGGVYALQNRSNRLLLDYAPSGNAFRPVQRPPLQPSGQRWELIPGDGYVTIRNLVSGLILDSLGTTTDGADAGVAAPSGSTAQQWEIVPTDNGWFLLSNRATRRCLDNIGATDDTAPVRMWWCGRHPNQQWRLARWP